MGSGSAWSAETGCDCDDKTCPRGAPSPPDTGPCELHRARRRALWCEAHTEVPVSQSGRGFGCGSGRSYLHCMLSLLLLRRPLIHHCLRTPLQKQLQSRQLLLRPLCLHRRRHSLRCSESALWCNSRCRSAAGGQSYSLVARDAHRCRARMAAPGSQMPWGTSRQQFLVRSGALIPCEYFLTGERGWRAPIGNLGSSGLSSHYVTCNRSVPLLKSVWGIIYTCKSFPRKTK